MAKGEYYSIRDIANVSGQPGSIITDTMDFLTRYGFVRKTGGNDPLFRKSSITLSPNQTMEILQHIAKPQARSA